jgi:peptide-methionine (S)-S-oxide reductase
MRMRIVACFTLIMSTIFHFSLAKDAKVTGKENTQEGIFAMGCFWSGADAFADHITHKNLPGILEVRVGYTGGISTNPTYPAHEGHQEAVKVTFDPNRISYETILNIFWHNIDPFDDKGQFCDKGPSYTTTIFFTDDAQKKEALESKKAIEQKLKKSVMTKMKAATPFYEAEEYHQDYKIKNPVRYNSYRSGCGRDKRLSEIWE